MSEGCVQVAMEPPGPRWEGMLRAWWDPGHPQRTPARASLGLPTDRPLVMTGHQAEMWHAGILAKFLAAEALAACTGGAPAWLIADQDDNDGLAVPVPVRDERGALGVERVLLAEDGAPGVPTGGRPPAAAPWWHGSPEPCDSPRSHDSPEPCDSSRWHGSPEPCVPPRWHGSPEPCVPPRSHGSPKPCALPVVRPLALASVERGLRQIAAAMNGARAEQTLARQLAAALRRLSAPWLAPAPTVFATDLSGTEVFAELVGRMREDPMGAVRAYNTAAAESIEAGVGALEVAGERVELPLWRVRWGAPRERVYADELDGIEPAELAPRALLMTAIVRLALCDLFIHGTGGAAYDRVTERWIEMWLGRELAPAVMASADVLLPLEEAGVGESDVARAVWRAHHAQHDPGAVGLEALGREKRRLVERIEREKAAGRDPAPAFRELQEMLAGYRADQRVRLDALESEARRLAGALASRDVAHERTWAFPLHEPAAIDALRDEITRRVCAREGNPCCC